MDHWKVWNWGLSQMPNWFNLLKRKDYPLIKSEQLSFFWNSKSDKVARGWLISHSSNGDSSLSTVENDNPIVSGCRKQLQKADYWRCWLVESGKVCNECLSRKKNHHRGGNRYLVIVDIYEYVGDYTLGWLIYVLDRIWGYYTSGIMLRHYPFYSCHSAQSIIYI